MVRCVGDEVKEGREWNVRGRFACAQAHAGGTTAAVDAAAAPAADRRSLVVPALVVGVVALSFAAPFFRKAAPTHPLAASAIRLACAALLLAPFVLRAARTAPTTGSWAMRSPPAWPTPSISAPGSRRSA
jgi:hypothetical protein